MSSEDGSQPTPGPWYPERKPVARGRRERFGALFALVAILVGVILSVVRSAGSSKTYLQTTTETFVSSDGRTACAIATAEDKLFSSVTCGGRGISADPSDSDGSDGRCEGNVYGYVMLTGSGRTSFRCSDSGIGLLGALTFTPDVAMESVPFVCRESGGEVTCSLTTGRKSGTGFAVSATTMRKVSE